MVWHGHHTQPLVQPPKQAQDNRKQDNLRNQNSPQENRGVLRFWCWCLAGCVVWRVWFFPKQDLVFSATILLLPCTCNWFFPVLAVFFRHHWAHKKMVFPSTNYFCSGYNQISKHVKPISNSCNNLFCATLSKSQPIHALLLLFHFISYLQPLHYTPTAVPKISLIQYLYVPTLSNVLKNLPHYALLCTSHITKATNTYHTPVYNLQAACSATTLNCNANTQPMMNCPNHKPAHAAILKLCVPDTNTLRARYKLIMQLQYLHFMSISWVHKCT